MASPQNDSQSDQPTPATGEDTGNQQSGGVTGTLGAQMNVIGFTETMKPNFTTYKKMLLNPTIYLARKITHAPLKAAPWTYSGADDSVPEDRVEFVKQALEPLRRTFMMDVLRALDFGFTPMEKVWEVKPVNGKLQLVYGKLKPLSHKVSSPMLDRATGAFRGIKNAAPGATVILPPNKSFWFVNDGGVADWWGTPRNEVARKAWMNWEQTIDKLGKYESLSAGPIPLVQYPTGQGHNASGNKVDNFEIAQQLMAALTKGNGVLMPKILDQAARELARIMQGGDISQLYAWTISFLETKQSRVKDFLEPAVHFERLMMRAWVVPERTATEGAHGTKAEAETQGDLVLSMGQDLMGDIVQCVNRWLVNPLLVFNFGPDAKDSVTVGFEPLVDEKAALMRDIVKEALTATSIPEGFLEFVSEVEAIEGVGVPVKDRDPESDIRTAQRVLTEVLQDMLQAPPQDPTQPPNPGNNPDDPKN